MIIHLCRLLLSLSLSLSLFLSQRAVAKGERIVIGYWAGGQEVEGNKQFLFLLLLKTKRGENGIEKREMRCLY
jgi:hypothetical protein